MPLQKEDVLLSNIKCPPNIVINLSRCITYYTKHSKVFFFVFEWTSTHGRCFSFFGGSIEGTFHHSYANFPKTLLYSTLLKEDVQEVDRISIFIFDFSSWWNFFFSFEAQQQTSRPDWTSHWQSSQVKLIGRGWEGVPPALHWVWTQDEIWWNFTSTSLSKKQKGFPPNQWPKTSNTSILGIRLLGYWCTLAVG